MKENEWKKWMGDRKLEINSHNSFGSETTRKDLSELGIKKPLKKGVFIRSENETNYQFFAKSNFLHIST